MTKRPKINPAAIDLLARYFNTHRKGVPEWLKNSREAYLRAGVAGEGRLIILNYVKGPSRRNTYIECIDFVGISGTAIDRNFLEWANPDAAAGGATAVAEIEGGQGNGGKAYLRQMFDRGFFISVCDAKLSVVSFLDDAKYILGFFPDDARGADNPGDNPTLAGIREYACRWLDALGYSKTHNITIVRGVSPIKPVEPDRLLDEIQQFPQARQTIESCKVQYFSNGEFRRELRVRRPPLHPAFPNPISVPIPASLALGSRTIATARRPDFPEGMLELCVAASPLRSQALQSWNRIDFHGSGVRVVGYKSATEIPLEQAAYAGYLFGKCTVPLLTDPKENYEAQGRGPLIDGPLPEALYGFIAEEADKLLAHLAKQEQSVATRKKRRNLEKLNELLCKWIENKLTSVTGLSDTGEETGPGARRRRQRTKTAHEPPVKLRVHRQQLNLCVGVEYVLRAVAEDADGRPVPPGKLVWRSSNSAVVPVHPEKGIVFGKSAGLASITVQNERGLASKPTAVAVQRAIQIEIKSGSPARVGSNRRLPLSTRVRTFQGQSWKDPAVSWRSSDARIATVGQDGTVIGGEVGEADLIAFANEVESAPVHVEVEHGGAGKPKGGGQGRPRILLSRDHVCPFDGTEVMLPQTHPPIWQRPEKPDYDNNVFWINLQHPLADALLRYGEQSVQWRSYHFQRLIEVYTIIESRGKFADNENLDVDQVLSEIHEIEATLYADAKEEIFRLLFEEGVDLATLGTSDDAIEG